jgi:hypothetical protein
MLTALEWSRVNLTAPERPAGLAEEISRSSGFVPLCGTKRQEGGATGPYDAQWTLPAFLTIPRLSGAVGTRRPAFAFLRHLFKRNDHPLTPQSFSPEGIVEWAAAERAAMEQEAAKATARSPEQADARAA